MCVNISNHSDYNYYFGLNLFHIYVYPVIYPFLEEMLLLSILDFFSIKQINTMAVLCI